jgi:hypothetical protein
VTDIPVVEEEDDTDFADISEIITSKKGKLRVKKTASAKLDIENKKAKKKKIENQLTKEAQYNPATTYAA